MRRLPSQFTDPRQRLGLAGETAERLPPLAPLSARPFPFPRGTELHHGHTAVELGDGSEHLADQATRRIIRVRGQIGPRVGRDDLPAENIGVSTACGAINAAWEIEEFFGGKPWRKTAGYKTLSQQARLDRLKEGVAIVGRTQWPAP
jgi:hypothetical protein